MGKPAKRRAASRMRSRNPTPSRSVWGMLSVVLGFAGAAVYIASVAFAIADGGLRTTTDAAASRATLCIAGLLCGAGLLVAVLGLRRGVQRKSAVVGALVSVSFLAFAGLSLFK